MAASLEDEAGEVWGGELPRAGDLRAFYPPARWQPGEVIRQDLGINTNPDLAAGDDWLILGRVTLH
jgi:hypothetical protein